MYRYSGGVWNSLPTTLSREDEVYFYFTAETPGFSPFAISSMKINTRSIELLQTKMKKIRLIIRVICLKEKNKKI